MFYDPILKKVLLCVPLVDSLDVNDTCKSLITNLKRHFYLCRNHTNAHNPRK